MTNNEGEKPITNTEPKPAAEAADPLAKRIEDIKQRQADLKKQIEEQKQAAEDAKYSWEKDVLAPIIEGMENDLDVINEELKQAERELVDKGKNA